MGRSFPLMRCLLALLILAQPFMACQATADHLLARMGRLVKETRYKGTEPYTGMDCAVEYLAENIDWLEHHIDTYGSIVAKQPDIWGEARLTKHRDEYERIMYQELGGFQQLINARILQTDSSFLAQSLALSAAAAGEVPDTPELKAAESITTSTDKIQGADKIGLEPVLHLDQLSRYLQHLQELRRIGEGDDTSDSPGYSLNLVRIPVSILPGKLTREGFGAEITVTATPVLSDDLLPTTFRNLVINDLVDQLGLPLVRAVESREEIEEELDKRKKYADARERLDKMLECLEKHYHGGADVVQSECFPTIRRAASNSALRETVAFCLAELLSFEGYPVAEKFNTKCDGQPSSVEIKAAPRTVPIEMLERAWQSIDTSKLGLQSSTGGQSPSSAAGGAENATRVQTLHELPGVLAFDDHPSHRPVEEREETVLTPSPEKSNTLTLVGPGDDQLSKSALLLLELYCSIGCYEKYLEKSGRACDCCAVDMDNCGLSQPTDDSTEEEREAALKCLVKNILALQGLPEEDFGVVNTIINTVNASLTAQVNGAANELIAVTPSGRPRRAINPMHPSGMAKIFGIENLVLMGDFFGKAYYGRYIRWAGYKKCKDSKGKAQECRVDLLDAQRWLRSEMVAAHEFFAATENVNVLYAFANPESGLADAIRGGHIGDTDVVGLVNQPSVESFRWAFFDMIHTGNTCNAFDLAMAIQLGAEATDPEARNPVEALAWAYVVEAALLNQRLNDDIRKLAQAKQRYDIDPGRGLNFYIPDSVMRPESGAEHLHGEFQDATTYFQRYVEVRWPIHVFALDPREQDQNVADASKRRREMQFALSLGFVTGKIGSNSLTRYSRTLENEIQTISLNRTAAGFSHGNDTFGWRFAPRIQALEPPGTLTVLAESICGPFQNRDLNQRDIEPGMRECVAIVIMPSFVPYADFDVRTNWFKLSNPKNAALTMKDTMRLSRAITSMRNSRAQCARCQHLYRDGELMRLMRRVDQLDRELPLQTMRAQVPYENTLGGFEMFNTGVTDLAPELIGWYGAPGVTVSDESTNTFDCGCTAGCASGGRVVIQQQGDKTQPLPICEGDGTTLFLVGDNFSVHDTKVIAGGVCIPHVQLVSREIMRVTIPSCVNVVDVDGKPYVSVYAATPYGVTNHLHVPVHTRKLTSETKSLVKAEVESQIKAQNLTPTIAHSLELVNADDKKLLLNAVCQDPSDPGVLTYSVRPGSTTPKLRYKVSHPPAIGQSAVISAVFVHKDKYLGTEPVVVARFVIDGSGNEFSATGNDLPLMTGETPPLERLLEQLSTEPNLPYQDLTDGKEDLKLAYFAQIGGPQVPVLIPEALDVEVAMLCKCNPVAASHSPTPAPASTTSTIAPTPANDGSDCGCREPIPSPVKSQVRFLANPVPVASDSPQSGVILTQLEVPTNGIPAISESDVTKTLSTVTAAAELLSAPQGLTTIVEQIATPSSVEEQQQQVEPQQEQQQVECANEPAATVTTTGATVVNVNVNIPEQKCDRVQYECFDESKRPLWTQFKVKVEECARNVRDQLPCY